MKAMRLQAKKGRDPSLTVNLEAGQGYLSCSQAPFREPSMCSLVSIVEKHSLVEGESGAHQRTLYHRQSVVDK